MVYRSNIEEAGVIHVGRYQDEDWNYENRKVSPDNQLDENEIVLSAFIYCKMLDKTLPRSPNNYLVV